jgi:hypothetical protein
MVSGDAARFRARRAGRITPLRRRVGDVTALTELLTELEDELATRRERQRVGGHGSAGRPHDRGPTRSSDDTTTQGTGADRRRRLRRLAPGRRRRVGLVETQLINLAKRGRLAGLHILAAGYNVELRRYNQQLAQQSPKPGPVPAPAGPRRRRASLRRYSPATLLAGEPPPGRGYFVYRQQLRLFHGGDAPRGRTTGRRTAGSGGGSTGRPAAATGRVVRRDGFPLTGRRHPSEGHCAHQQPPVSRASRGFALLPASSFPCPLSPHGGWRRASSSRRVARELTCLTSASAWSERRRDLTPPDHVPRALPYGRAALAQRPALLSPPPERHAPGQPDRRRHYLALLSWYLMVTLRLMRRPRGGAAGTWQLRDNATVHPNG